MLALEQLTDPKVALSLSAADRAYIDWQAGWYRTARDVQMPPDPDEQVAWLKRNAASLLHGADVADPWTDMGYMAGRGFGKTRVGAEWLGRIAYECAEGLPYGVIAPTQNDVRMTCFEGQSGLLNVIPPECIAKYSADDLRITLTNGATIRGFSAEKAERLRGPEHHAIWCFVAGTMIATPSGPVPLEQLTAGSTVLTRKGPRTVLANSERVADVGEVAFSTGAKLVGTTDHPVYTSHGWTDLGRLRQGDTVCAIGVSNGVGDAGTNTGAGTTNGRTSPLSPSARSTCTEQYGRLRTAQSLPATTSITETATSSTTPSATLSACRTASTSATISETHQSPARIGAPRPMLSASAASAETSPCGSASSRPLCAGAAPSVPPTLNAPRTEPADAAVPPSGPETGTSAASVVSTWQPMGRQSVYCLKVDGEPEYFANGILVHNCDEIAAWGRDAEYTLDMALMGLRIGAHPRFLWTSTPKPNALVRKLTKPQPGRIVVRGATYDNRANLAKTFFDNVAKYEGTKLGRQEIYGELIDPEEAGVIRRSWFKLWPEKKPLPRLDWIIMSLDTAFTERTIGKQGDADPTACSVWGVFQHERRSNIMLLDCWEDHLGMPDLIRRVKRELNTAYGDDADQALIKPMFGSSKPLTSGRKPDILLIEDKGSGISLRQMLAEAAIEAYAYNPGRADKLSRLHIVSPVFAQRRVWLPESAKQPGQPRTWAEPLVNQLCSFAGEGSIKHDDLLDTTTQAIRLALDKGMLSVLSEERTRKAAEAEMDKRPRKQYSNPYSQ